jgi:hypothetical protein
MTVIFQLFCAEDLQKLTHPQLEDLKKTVMDALAEDHTSTTPSQGYGSQNPRVPRPLVLETTQDTTPPPGTPPQLREALSHRFHEVSHQLMSPQLHAPQQNFNFQHLLDQRNGIASAEENLILQWAISCEVNNFKFYNRLLHVRKKAYEWFFKATQGQRPKGPDSLYSPFNPLHPLYNLFYGVSKPELPPTEDTNKPSS